MFSQTFANHTPIQRFNILSTTESTNNYAMAKLHAGMVKEGFCFLALHQTAGRGQRGKQWVAAPGENITMSSVFEPPPSVSSNIAANPFVFSAAIALGCYDFIKDFGVDDLSIKWPNDIYISDRKAAGILIENVMKGNAWTASIVGTGVNVNQQQFEEGAGKPTSIGVATGRTYDVIRLGRQLHLQLLKRYHELKDRPKSEIMEEYNSVLYRRGQQVRLRRNNISFHAVINEVLENGELKVITGTVEQHFKSGEIEFV